MALASVALVVYGNLSALAFGGGLPGGSLPAAGLGLAFAALVVAVALRAGLRPADLGLTRRRAAGSVLAGAALAAVAAAGALAVLRFPPLVGQPVSFGPVAALADSGLALHVLVLLPLAVVIPEELAFRGALLAALRRRYRAVSAVALSAATFMLWHVIVVGATLGQTNLAGSLLFSALGASLALLALFAGGVVLAALRIATDNLGAPIAAHWGFNAALLLGLWALA